MLRQIDPQLGKAELKFRQHLLVFAPQTQALCLWLQAAQDACHFQNLDVLDWTASTYSSLHYLHVHELFPLLLVEGAN
jgi:hypothetical protein